MMQKQPITHGLIGKKLGHSFSKKYFTEKFAKEGIPAAYELFEIPDIKDFPALWEEHPHLLGMNVTIPYKQEVIPYLTRVLPEAASIGAVNTIKRLPEGLVGYNSDLWGFHDDVLEWFGEKSLPGSAIILGTGGAARAVAYCLKNLFNISDAVCLSRRGGREFMGLPVLGYEEAAGLADPYWQFVINTTPLGMAPNTENAPGIPYGKFRTQELAFAYDLVYNPAHTKFMELAKQNGAFVRNGMGMLIGQAEKAWSFWTNLSNNS